MKQLDLEANHGLLSEWKMKNGHRASGPAAP